MKNIEQLSPYHQESIDRAVQHLLDPTHLSTLPHYLTVDSELSKIWGEKPLFISTFRHALLEPWSGQLQGDSLAKLFINRAGNIDVSHQIWESHPVGLGSLKLDVGPFTVNIVPDIPNVTQWGNPHYSARQKLIETINIISSRSAQDELHARMYGLCIPMEKQIMVDDRMDEIMYTFSSVVTEELNHNSSLTHLCLRWEKSLRNLMGCPMESGLNIEPSSSSRVNQQVVETLLVLDERAGLLTLFDRMFDQGHGNLFAGGIGDKLIRVGFSKKSGRLEVINYDPASNARLGKPKPISTEDVLELLKQNELIATGKIFSVGLLLGSTQIPIVYLGNGAREFELAKQGLGIQNTSGLLQMTEDWKDSWPIFQLLGTDQPRFPGQASLYLWLGADVINYHHQALRAGEPLTLSNKEYLKL